MTTIYDRISPIYDWITVSERPYRQRALKLLALETGQRLLEIGCGTGQALAQMVPVVGEKGHLIGLDLSPGMIRQAKNSLDRGEPAPISLLLAKGQQIPLQAGSCDAVFVSFTLELLDITAQHRLLAETRRVLKENGKLALVTLSTHQQTVMSDAYWSLHEAFPGVIDCRPINAALILNTAGFAIVEQDYRLLYGLPVSILLASTSRPPAADS